MKIVVPDNAGVEQVHWRRYRHCHRRWGRRRCHGGRHYRGYRYWGGPGIHLYIGKGHRHRGHRGRRYRGW
jgi:hypothetical protein